MSEARHVTPRPRRLNSGSWVEEEQTFPNDREIPEDVVSRGGTESLDAAKQHLGRADSR
jgi:hypothetical protein